LEEAKKGVARKRAGRGPEEVRKKLGRGFAEARKGLERG
jgi:hypothetical protein